YFGGDMNAAVALGGQVAGRITDIRPVADIVRECADDCLAVLHELATRYPLV
ncbi:MAG: enoyl-[acyl-carrier protein] reductase, partial [Acidimicrobiaceae bacterium]